MEDTGNGTRELRFTITNGLPDDSPAREIRREVFLQEQGFQNEFDAVDAAAWHVVLWLDGNPAATGRVFQKEGEPGTFCIGRIAVRKPRRGMGCGAQVIRRLERLAEELGAVQIELSAQTRVKGFYESMGYFAYGKEYKDEFCPHIAMAKRLVKDGANG